MNAGRGIYDLRRGDRVRSMNGDVGTVDRSTVREVEITTDGGDRVLVPRFDHAWTWIESGAALSEWARREKELRLAEERVASAREELDLAEREVCEAERHRDAIRRSLEPTP